MLARRSLTLLHLQHVQTFAAETRSDAETVHEGSPTFRRMCGLSLSPAPIAVLRGAYSPIRRPARRQRKICGWAGWGNRGAVYYLHM